MPYMKNYLEDVLDALDDEDPEAMQVEMQDKVDRRAIDVLFSDRQVFRPVSEVKLCV